VRKTTPLAFPDKEESMQFPIAIHNWIYLILSLVGLFVIVSALRSKRQADTSQDWLGVQGNEIINRYPVDNTVMIYYDPNNPGQAVLERVTKTGWLQVVIGIALFLAGIYLAIK
jgi:uncharacterized membrane protein HdeD (DUF308 family)